MSWTEWNEATSRYIKEVTDTWLGPMWLCFGVLLTHVLIGLFVSYIGVKRPRWDA